MHQGCDCMRLWNCCRRLYVVLGRLNLAAGTQHQKSHAVSAPIGCLTGLQLSAARPSPSPNTKFGMEERALYLNLALIFFRSQAVPFLLPAWALHRTR